MDLAAIQRLYNIRMNGQSPRYARLSFLQRCLKGTQYQDKAYDFYLNQSSNFSYIPLRSRKPSVVYNMCKILVDRSTDMLFGDLHWPSFYIDNPEHKEIQQALNSLVKHTSFVSSWRHAARIGSIGSVVIIFKIVDGRLYHEVLNAKDCTPTFNPRVPDDIIKIRQQFQIRGEDLIPFGYTTLEPKSLYWFTKEFTETEEIEYFPVLGSQANAPKLVGALLKKNPERSFEHKLGFVPGVWIKNLESDDILDGACTFEELITSGLQSELDYQISGIGRVFAYTADPLLVIRDPSLLDDESESAQVARMNGNALLLNEDGDAKNLEIQAKAQAVNLDFVDKLRKFAMELGRGNRADPDKISAINSGKALALLHKDIIGLTSELRTSYGPALIRYLQKILMACEKYQLLYPEFEGLDVSSANITLDLRWGAFFEPTNEDIRSMSLSVTEGINNHTISEEYGTEYIARDMKIDDTQMIRKQIAQERDDEQERAIELDSAQQLSQAKKADQIGPKRSAAPPPESA